MAPRRIFLKGRLQQLAQKDLRGGFRKDRQKRNACRKCTWRSSRAEDSPQELPLPGTVKRTGRSDGRSALRPGESALLFGADRANFREPLRSARGPAPMHHGCDRKSQIICENLPDSDGPVRHSDRPNAARWQPHRRQRESRSRSACLLIRAAHHRTPDFRKQRKRRHGYRKPEAFRYAR